MSPREEQDSLWGGIAPLELDEDLEPPPPPPDEDLDSPPPPVSSSAKQEKKEVPVPTMPSTLPPAFSTFVTELHSTPSAVKASAERPLSVPLSKKPDDGGDFNTIAHCFQDIARHVLSGLAVLKSLNAFLKKYALTREQGAKKQLELIHVMSTRTGDAVTFGKGLDRLLDNFRRAADRELNFVGKLNGLAQDMETNFNHLEVQRKTVTDEEKRITGDFRRHLTALEKSKRECLRYIDQLKALKDPKPELAKRPPPDKATSATGQMAKLFAKAKSSMAQAAQNLMQLPEEEVRTKLVAMMKHHQEMLSVVNKRQTEYWHEQVPRLCDMLRRIERTRLDYLKTKLSMIQAANEEFVAPFPVESSDLGLALEAVNVRGDITTFVETMIRNYGSQQSVDARTWDLPFLPEQVAEGNLGSDRLFGRRLGAVMAKQAEVPELANLEIPAVIHYSLDLIRKHGGTTTEGIFRISASSEAVQRVKEQLEDGNFSALSNDPHVMAGILKQYLRDLPETLIPPEVFGPAMELTQAEDKTKVRPAPAALLELLANLDPLSQLILSEIVRLLAEVVANQSSTLMGFNNLAIVFAPNIMRNPSEDPMDAYATAKDENRFVELLFDAIAKQQKGLA